MSCLIDVDCDDTYEELHCKLTKARKKFRCGECRDDINKGDMHEVFVGKSDGIDTHRTCLICCEIMNKFLCSWHYGEMYEDIFNAIDHEPDLEDCILMQCSKDQYNQLIRFVSFLQEDPYEEEEDE